MVNRMKILDEPPNAEDDTTDANKRKSGLDPSLVNGENSKWSDSTSGRSSPIVPKYKEELEEIRRKSELEQMQRIRKRAQVSCYCHLILVCMYALFGREFLC